MNYYEVFRNYYIHEQNDTVFWEYVKLEKSTFPLITRLVTKRYNFIDILGLGNNET